VQHDEAAIGRPQANHAARVAEGSDLARVNRGVLACVEGNGRHHRCPNHGGGGGEAASDLQERESERVVAAGSDQLLKKVQVNHDDACDEEGRHRAMRRT
jgi:hypothetical protein